MLQDVRAISSERVLQGGRWSLAIVAPLLAIMSRNDASIWMFIAEVLFVSSAFTANHFVKTTPLPARPWIITTLGDTLGVFILQLTSVGLETTTALLLTWCIFEWALISVPAAVYWTAGANILSLLLIITQNDSNYIKYESILLLCVLNFIVSIMLWLIAQRAASLIHIKELRDNVIESMKKIQELEQIVRQMTDYTMDVQNRAVIDQLTGLYSQVYFHNRLLIEVEKIRQEGGVLSLVLCDIDKFKSFNDRFGHYLGDDVLRSVAHVILDSLQEPFWLAGRIGGEEMIVALPDTSCAEAYSYAEALREKISNTVVMGTTGPLRVTVSIGVASFPDAATDAIHLTKCADQAMYRAKASGRNRVEQYQSTINFGNDTSRLVSSVDRSNEWA